MSYFDEKSEPNLI